jgi:hypothetical protein
MHFARRTNVLTPKTCCSSQGCVCGGTRNPDNFGLQDSVQHTVQVVHLLAFISITSADTQRSTWNIRHVNGGSRYGRGRPGWSPTRHWTVEQDEVTFVVVGIFLAKSLEMVDWQPACSRRAGPWMRPRHWTSVFPDALWTSSASQWNHVGNNPLILDYTRNRWENKRHRSYW